MGVFKSIEEFATYVGKEFLTPPFYITKIITTDRWERGPTNYAEVKYKAMMEGEGIIPFKEVQVRYQMVKDKLMSNSIDYKQFIIKQDSDWWDTNHLYFNGHNVVTYISKKREKFYDGEDSQSWCDFWVFNLDSIENYPQNLSEGNFTDLWLNKYTTTIRNFLKQSDGGPFYKIPIKKALAFAFMNWKDSPLKEN